MTPQPATFVPFESRELLVRCKSYEGSGKGHNEKVAPWRHSKKTRDGRLKRALRGTAKVPLDSRLISLHCRARVHENTRSVTSVNTRFLSYLTVPTKDGLKQKG